MIIFSLILVASILFVSGLAGVALWFYHMDKAEIAKDWDLKSLHTVRAWNAAQFVAMFAADVYLFVFLATAPTAHTPTLVVLAGLAVFYVRWCRHKKKSIPTQIAVERASHSLKIVTAGRK